MSEVNKQLETIAVEDLKKIKTMPIGSKERADAISDVSVLLKHLNDSIESETRAADSATKALMAEHEYETKLKDLEFKAKADETEKALKCKELEIKLQDTELKAKEVSLRTEKDAQQIKVEKRKVWVDAGTTVLKVGASAAVTIVAIVADRQGWFVGKLGTSFAPKPRL